MKQESENGLDARLDAALRALPDKPVASNFTARVLDAVGRAEVLEPARREFFLTGWLPRFAPAALALVAALLTYQVRTEARSVALARGLAAVSQVASLPGPDVLKDFETVRHLSRAPAADVELLALMQ